MCEQDLPLKRSELRPSVAVMDSSVQPLELLGVLFSAAAWCCSLATTLMPSWLTLSTELLPAESYLLGLWETCVIQGVGMQECRPYNSLLGLPSDIKLARIMMCTALGAGLLGLLMTIPGMNMINSCQHWRELSCKRVLKAVGGTLSLASGILVLVPVSYIAHLTVVRFFDDSVPDMVPRWEFGDSLFCGWTAGVMYLMAGTLLLTSCLCLETQNRNLPVHTALVPVRAGCRSARSRTEYV